MERIQPIQNLPEPRDPYGVRARSAPETDRDEDVIDDLRVC